MSVLSRPSTPSSAEAHADDRPGRPAWRRAVVPAVLVLVVTSFGSAAAALGFSLSPQVSAPPVAYPAWWPPLSLFWAVWLVIYPCSALALWHVWRRRHDADVRGALTAFVVRPQGAAVALQRLSRRASPTAERRTACRHRRARTVDP